MMRMVEPRRAQASVEYFVILAVVIIVCLAVFAFMAEFSERKGSRVTAPSCDVEGFTISVSGIKGTEVSLKADRDVRLKWAEWDGVRSMSIPLAGSPFSQGSSVSLEFPSCGSGLLHVAYSLPDESASLQSSNNGSIVYVERFNLSSLSCGSS